MINCNIANWSADMKFFGTFLLIGIMIPSFAMASSDEDLQFIAGEPNIEHGIRFVRMAPRDGNPSLVDIQGRLSLKTDINTLNPYIYFDVSRASMLRYGYQPYHVQINIEYLDIGTDSLAIQYDSMGDTVGANYKEVAWNKTGTDKWLTKTIEVKDAQFCNGQQGVADFRICAGIENDEYIASVSIKCLGASSKDPRIIRPEPSLGKKKWVTMPIRQPVIVAPRELSQQEQIALDHLCSRFEHLGTNRPSVVYSLPDRESSNSDSDYIVFGTVGDIPQAIDCPNAKAKMECINQIDDRAMRNQSYALVKDRLGDANVLYALGGGKMGVVFAISHVETHLWYDKNNLAIHLDKVASIESPDFRQRELYINIGYGLSRNRITPDTWTIEDWKAYIDKLVLARYSAWSFYLWGDSEYAYPESNVNRDKNILLHQTLEEAIRYSHMRGMKVGYHITPTMVPYDLLAKHPELASTLEYQADGIVCPSKSESWNLIIPVCRNQIHWFRECDFFSIWFYDCGGCFCDQCRVPEQQLRTLVRQVEELDKIIQEENPNATVQVGTWGIWRYERMHHFYIREKFMQEINRLFADRKDKLIISDGIYVDPGCEPLFSLAGKYGIDAKAFLYQTNIEDGQPFAFPMTRYFEKWVPAAKKAGAAEIYLMRMETLTKYPQDFTAGLLFWHPDAKGRDAVRLYSMYTMGDSDAGNLLYRALMDIDDFAWYGYRGGAADAKRGDLIDNYIKSAIDILPMDRQKDLDWLARTGAGYKILGKAVEQMANEDSEGIVATMEEFRQALIDSPDLKSQVDSDAWMNLSKSFVRFFYTGWENNHF